MGHRYDYWRLRWLWADGICSPRGSAASALGAGDSNIDGRGRVSADAPHHRTPLPSQGGRDVHHLLMLLLLPGGGYQLCRFSELLGLKPCPAQVWYQYKLSGVV